MCWHVCRTCANNSHNITNHVLQLVLTQAYMLLPAVCRPYPEKKGGPIRFDSLNSPDGYNSHSAYVSGIAAKQARGPAKATAA